MLMNISMVGDQMGFFFSLALWRNACLENLKVICINNIKLFNNNKKYKTQKTMLDNCNGRINVRWLGLKIMYKMYFWLYISWNLYWNHKHTVSSSSSCTVSRREEQRLLLCYTLYLKCIWCERWSLWYHEWIYMDG